MKPVFPTPGKSLWLTPCGKREGTGKVRVMNAAHAYLHALVRSARPVVMKPGRYMLVDALRGVAVLMMLVFHLVWDLDHFGGLLDTHVLFWRAWQETIVALFTVIFGVYLVLRRLQAQRTQAQNSTTRIWRGYFLRAAVLLTWAALISLATLLALGEERFVRFGTIHLLGVTTVVCYPLLRFRWLNLGLGFVLLGAGIVLESLDAKPGAWWLEWLVPTSGQAVDSAPLFPVAAGVFIGVFLGNLVIAHDPWLRRRPTSGRTAQLERQAKSGQLERLDDRLRFLPGWVRRISGSLVLLGQNSLLIYLAHQPILLGLLATLGIIRLW